MTIPTFDNGSALEPTDVNLLLSSGKSLEPVTSTEAQLSSVFLDSADSLLKVKDSNGLIHPLSDGRYNSSATYTDYTDFSNSMKFSMLRVDSYPTVSGTDSFTTHARVKDGYGNLAYGNYPSTGSGVTADDIVNPEAYMIGGFIECNSRDQDNTSYIQLYPFNGYIKENNTSDYEVTITLDIEDTVTSGDNYNGVNITGNTVNTLQTTGVIGGGTVTTSYTLTLKKVSGTYSIEINDGSTTTVISSGTDSSLQYIQFQTNSISTFATASSNIYPTNVSITNGDVLVMVRDD